MPPELMAKNGRYALCCSLVGVNLRLIFPFHVSIHDPILYCSLPSAYCLTSPSPALRHALCFLSLMAGFLRLFS